MVIYFKKPNKLTNTWAPLERNFLKSPNLVTLELLPADQKKSPNVSKSCPKLISLEKDRF